MPREFTSSSIQIGKERRIVSEKAKLRRCGRKRPYFQAPLPPLHNASSKAINGSMNAPRTKLETQTIKSLKSNPCDSRDCGLRPKKRVKESTFPPIHPSRNAPKSRPAGSRWPDRHCKCLRRVAGTKRLMNHWAKHSTRNRCRLHCRSLHCRCRASPPATPKNPKYLNRSNWACLKKTTSFECLDPCGANQCFPQQIHSSPTPFQASSTLHP